jgi:uncharacterized protein YuzE
MLLAHALPDFADDISELLRAKDRDDLVDQLGDVGVARWTSDRAVAAAYIYLESARVLNVVEQNIIGLRHGETVALRGKHWVNVDVDNFGRIAGIELLRPGDIPAGLAKFKASNES